MNNLNLMNQAFTSLFILLFNSFLWGQTTFYTENFNNGCASNCIASTYGGWTIVNNVGGTSGGAPNNWFVSCAEEGITPPGCGSTCIGDASLHIGANPGAGGDMGASFNETGAANATYKLVVSPTIDATGRSTITLSFDFIAYGSGACADDRLQLRLSTDNGATWPGAYYYCLTSVCCGACNGYSQGQWTTYTLALPAAFNNNPNIRVGFHWMNNGNGSGTDPSAAIDDIRMTVPVSLGVDLIDFSAKKEGSGNALQWDVVNERNLSHYDLERSMDGASFTKIYTATANCTSEDVCKYLYSDVNQNKTVYYRLKMVDFDGKFKYSSIISLDENNSNSVDYTSVVSNVSNDVLTISFNSKKKTTAKFTVYNTYGKEVINERDVSVKTGSNQKTFNTNKLASGVYILKIQFDNGDKTLSSKIIIP